MRLEAKNYDTNILYATQNIKESKQIKRLHHYLRILARVFPQASGLQSHTFFYYLFNPTFLDLVHKNDNTDKSESIFFAHLA